MTHQCTIAKVRTKIDQSSNLINFLPDSPPPAYSLVLSSELFGDNVDIRRTSDNKIESTSRVLSYKSSPTKKKLEVSPYASSPISKRTQNLLKTPPKTPRKISTTPTRVLE